MKFALICPGNEEHTDLVNHGRWNVAGNYVQHWCGILRGDYFTGNNIPLNPQVEEELLQTYDVVMINQNTNMYSITQYLANKIERKAKIVAFEDGSVDDITLISMALKRKLIDAARAVDMYLVYHEWGAQFFRLWTDKPVEAVGFPSATNSITPFLLPLEDRGNLIALGTFLGDGGADRNGLVSAMVAHKALPDWAKTALTYDKSRQERGEEPVERPFAAKYIPNLFQHDPVGQSYYYRHISQAKVAVHLDHRYTWGRFALECACLGIPCIGTPNNGTQHVLWPSLCVTPFTTIDHAIELVRKVGTDEELRRNLVEHARYALEEFSDEVIKQRFMRAVSKLGIE